MGGMRGRLGSLASRHKRGKNDTCGHLDSGGYVVTRTKLRHKLRVDAIEECRAEVMLMINEFASTRKTITTTQAEATLLKVLLRLTALLGKAPKVGKQ
jgi:hypothetical protein